MKPVSSPNPHALQGGHFDRDVKKVKTCLQRTVCYGTTTLGAIVALVAIKWLIIDPIDLSCRTDEEGYQVSDPAVLASCDSLTGMVTKVFAVLIAIGILKVVCRFEMSSRKDPAATG